MQNPQGTDCRNGHRMEVPQLLLGTSSSHVFLRRTFPHCHAPEGPFRLGFLRRNKKNLTPFWAEMEPSWCSSSSSTAVALLPVLESLSHPPLLGLYFNPSLNSGSHLTPHQPELVPFFTEVRTQSLVKLTSCLPKVWFSKWRQEAESCSAEPKPSPSLLQTDIQRIQTKSTLSGRSTQANPKKTPNLQQIFCILLLENNHNSAGTPALAEEVFYTPPVTQPCPQLLWMEVKGACVQPAELLSCSEAAPESLPKRFAGVPWLWLCLHEGLILHCSVHILLTLKAFNGKSSQKIVLAASQCLAVNPGHCSSSPPASEGQVLQNRHGQQKRDSKAFLLS
ncbi:hypothetical protein EK904_014110 [Melospiza melodia maxima]|nr:hypothetical protein EK904_014110 [Melospiza melodia maxima]